MAASDIQRVVSIIFAGEDRLSPAARAAQRTLSEFGTGLSGSVDALAGFTAGAARLEAGILATGAAAAVEARASDKERWRMVLRVKVQTRRK